MLEYPKAKYHEKKEPRTVRSVDEELELGDEWKDSPAEFGKITAPSEDQMTDEQFDALPTKESYGVPKKNINPAKKLKTPPQVEGSTVLGADSFVGADPVVGIFDESDGK